MRLAVVLLAAAFVSLAASAPASADTPPNCTRAPGDHEGGANAYLMWTNPYLGKGAGYTYQDAGLTCSPAYLPKHRFRRIAAWGHHHWRKRYYRPSWVNIPIVNRGGLCPEGDCNLLKDGSRKHPA
jgi:hypothetical protein